MTKTYTYPVDVPGRTPVSGMTAVEVAKARLADMGLEYRVVEVSDTSKVWILHVGKGDDFNPAHRPRHYPSIIQCLAKDKDKAFEKMARHVADAEWSKAPNAMEDEKYVDVMHTIGSLMDCTGSDEEFKAIIGLASIHEWGLDVVIRDDQGELVIPPRPLADVFALIPEDFTFEKVGKTINDLRFFGTHTLPKSFGRWSGFTLEIDD